jgi:transcriptional regulator with XRE-family HTH domain
MTDQGARAVENQTLGTYLKNARAASGLTLRAVETMTGKAVSNGNLSQIESGAIAQPSPNTLYHLAATYKLDYSDLLSRAGHRVPAADTVPTAESELNGIPLRALEDLDGGERAELLKYIAFLKSQRD